MSTAIEVHEGSVTDADVDVIVNASNTIGALGSGVSGAIRVACGPGFQEAIERALADAGGPMEPGGVLVTDAGAHHRARHMVHVAVMDYRDDARRVRPDAERIRRGSEELWRAVETLPAGGGGEPGGAYSVGMVALGAGTGALGERLPTEIACETLREHLARHPSSRIGRVVFHGFTLPEYINILDVVSRWFDVEVPAELRDHIEQMRGTLDE